MNLLSISSPIDNSIDNGAIFEKVSLEPPAINFNPVNSTGVINADLFPPAIKFNPVNSTGVINADLFPPAISGVLPNAIAVVEANLNPPAIGFVEYLVPLPSNYLDNNLTFGSYTLNWGDPNNGTMGDGITNVYSTTVNINLFSTNFLNFSIPVASAITMVALSFLADLNIALQSDPTNIIKVIEFGHGVPVSFELAAGSYILTTTGDTVLSEFFANAMP